MKVNKLQVGYTIKFGGEMHEIKSVETDVSADKFVVGMVNSKGESRTLVMYRNDRVLAGPSVKLVKEEIAGEAHELIMKRLQAAEQRYGNNVLVGDLEEGFDDLIEELVDAIVYLWVMRRSK